MKRTKDQQPYYNEKPKRYSWSYKAPKCKIRINSTKKTKDLLDYKTVYEIKIIQT